MYKNSFLLFNSIVYGLYSCKNLDAIKSDFLPQLRMLIPFSHASLLLARKSDDGMRVIFSDPVCIPDYFTEAEVEYIKYADEDRLLWLTLTKEASLVQDSDLRNDDERLSDPIYLRCYKKYGIYDNVQYSIFYKERLLGVLTLFRTKADGLFGSDDIFYLRALGQHINRVIYDMSRHGAALKRTADIKGLAQGLGLTVREEQLLGLVFDFKSNSEIALELNLSENTVQKHLQNIFRKAKVSSKWDLMRYSHELNCD